MSAESNALHCVIEGDQGEARRILEDFLPGELFEFKIHLGAMIFLIDEEMISRRRLQKDHPCAGGRCVDPEAHAEGAHDL
jgi:hypothetical protein